MAEKVSELEHNTALSHELNKTPYGRCHDKDFTNENQRETSENDINDAFDSILFSEELISNESYQEGLMKGRKDGTLEGYHIGFHKGLNLGNEIGFYKGLIKVLTQDSLDLEKNEKIHSSLEKLVDLLNSFPKQNCHDDDIGRKLNDIRANFKKLMSLLKLNIAYPITPVISF